MAQWSVVERPSSDQPEEGSSPASEPSFSAARVDASGQEALLARVASLEALTREHGRAIDRLEAENRCLRRSALKWELCKYRAHTEPLSVCQPLTLPGANLLTVIRMEGFENMIAHLVTPWTGNKRLAGKVGWNKLQKTCRALRYAPVSLQLDPSVRIVPDNFPTIRRAVANINKQDLRDSAHVVVRSRAQPYAEQVVLDRRVILVADPVAVEMPVILGRISVCEGSEGTVVRGFVIRNNNTSDTWGATVDVRGCDVLIDSCQMSSSADDQTILNLTGSRGVTVRHNTIFGGQHGVVGITIDCAANVKILANTITDVEVGIKLQPSVTAVIRRNFIGRNQKGVQLNEDGVESIVEQGGFGRITLAGNTLSNRDGHDDVSFLKSLEVLLHPLLRRLSMASSSDVEQSAEPGDWNACRSSCGALGT